MKVVDVAGARDLADEIKADLLKLQVPGEPEHNHGKADQLLCKMLSWDRADEMVGQSHVDGTMSVTKQ